MMQQQQLYTMHVDVLKVNAFNMKMKGWRTRQEVKHTIGYCPVCQPLHTTRENEKNKQINL